MSHDVVIVKKTLPATCEEVYDAWLDAEGMSAWMTAGPATRASVELEARVGGKYSVVMHADDGRHWEHIGSYVALERPRRLQFTWISVGTDNQETLVTVELEARGDSCELTLTHERIPGEKARGEHREGWREVADRLGAVLSARVR